MEAASHPWPTLGVLLMRDGLVPKEILEEILSQQRDARGNRISGQRLGEILVERGIVTETQVSKLIAEQYELPYVDLEESDVNLGVARLLSPEISQRLSALPISSLPDGSLLLAVADPATVVFSDELRRELETPLRFVVVAPAAFAAAEAFVQRNAAAADDEEPAPLEPVSAVVVDLRPTEAEAEVEVDEVNPASDAPDDQFLGVERTVASLWPPPGALLVREGLVNEAELQAALAQQRLTASKRLGEILVDRGAVTATDIARLVAEQYELPFVDLGVEDVDPATARRLPEEIARRYSALPVRTLPDDSLQVVVADPTNVLYSDELRIALDVPLTLAVAAPNAIDVAITHVFDHARVPAEGPTAVEVAEVEVEAVAAGVELEPDVADVEVTHDEPALDEATPHEHEETPEDLMVDEIPELFAPPEAEADEETSSDDERPPISAFDEAEAFTSDETEDPSAIDQILAEAVEAVTHVPPDEAEEELAEVLVLPNDISMEAAEARAEVEEDADVEVEHELETPLALTEVVEPDAEPPTIEAPSADTLGDILERAVSLGATALHFAPHDGELEARARVDGVLRELGTIHETDAGTATRALHELHRIDANGASLDVQVTAVATTAGEKLTLHVHKREPFARTFRDLGMAPDTAEDVRRALERPLGLVVVGGPAESGTTTTLYAALQELRMPPCALATVEGPVAHVLPGVDQLEVEPTTHHAFARGLETVLRADPDVVILGHLPDSETAELATTAAATQCLVVAAVRARTMTGVLDQVLELGVRPAALAETLAGVVGQRLVRRICEECRETFYATEQDLTELDRPTDEAGRRLLARGSGCDSCGGTGYRGRVGVFEALPLTDKVRALIADQAPARKLERAARDAGARTLREDAVRLCLEGVTTADEVDRVLGDRTSARR